MAVQTGKAKETRKWVYGLGALILVLILMATGFAIMDPKSGGSDPTGPATSSPAAVQLLLEDEPGIVPNQVDVEITPAAVQEVQVEPPSVCKCARNLYDCNDFTTHDEAQACFDFCFEEKGDVHYLDSNDDGQACETLP